ncbi:hypothetical protein PPGU19_077750 (plasmid) [Paraburkholderia sp. PGU19]|nr:hypothetical protein PPGU19_077750 [Paraburkholderia sp. PGU19]
MFEKIANDDFSALAAQRFAALIFAVYEGANGVSFVQKMTYGVDTRFAGGASNEVFALLHDELSNLTV